MRPVSAKNLPTFTLRPVAPPDDAFLLRLYATTRAAELARTGWDATQRTDFIRSQFNARRIDYVRNYPGAEHAIILIEGRESGSWMVARSAQEIRLVNIELLPEQQGRGVGGALIRSLLNESVARALPVVLSVREENRAAERLYRRLGFSLQIRANGYLVMRRSPMRG